MRWITNRPDMLGYIPTFLRESDPRSAKEQLHDSYSHGGGWCPFQGFTLDISKPPEQWTLRYPEDPPMRLVGYTQLRNETVAVFEHAWVAIVTDGKYEVARMD